MATRAAPLRSPDVVVGAGVLVASVAAAAATRHWTVLLVPPIWVAIAWLSSVSLPRRFAALAAATVLLPSYPLGYGVSVDDVVPSAAAIAGLVLLARRGFPRLPRYAAVAFAAWIVAAIASAAVNADSIRELLRLSGPGVGRPVFWLVFTWAAFAIAQREGLRVLLLPVAAVAIVESVVTAGLYANCTEIHLGDVARPENRAVWESRRAIGVEQGAGTNVGEERIRCRATGTLGQSSNFLAAFLVTTIPVAGAAALAARRRARWLLLAGAAVAAAALVLTFTRAALIAVVVALLVTAIFSAPRRVLPAILVAAIVLGAASAAVPQIRRRLSNPANDRRALWYSGVRIFADHPAFGVGFGRYREVQLANRKYLDTPYGEPTSTAHNGFIGIAAEGGVVQLGAVLVLAGAIVAAGWRAAARARGTPQAALVAGAFGGAAGFLVQNMTNTLLLVPAAATYFWVFGGALLGAASRTEASGDLPADRA